MSSTPAPGPVGFRRAADWTRSAASDPAAGAPADPDRLVEELVVAVAARPSWTVLSGAGLSTESGIPDYRGPSGIRRSRGPMTYAEFTGSADGRRRYWARSHLGWRQIGDAVPNSGHRAVTALQRAGRVAGVITQNVDRLHQRSGCREVIDLHGTLEVIVCLDCGDRSSRTELETRLTAANPGFEALAEQDRTVNPDGDVELAEVHVSRFRTVDCLRCAGPRLKPDVVFFGESVPRPRVQASYAELDRTGALLVLGSSLSVMSGYRFVRHAHRHGYPVVILNQGATRGDAEADLRAWLPLGTTLTTLASRLA